MGASRDPAGTDSCARYILDHVSSPRSLRVDGFRGEAFLEPCSAAPKPPSHPWTWLPVAVGCDRHTPRWPPVPPGQTSGTSSCAWHWLPLRLQLILGVGFWGSCQGGSRKKAMAGQVSEPVGSLEEQQWGRWGLNSSLAPAGGLGQAPLPRVSVTLSENPCLGSRVSS